MKYMATLPLLSLPLLPAAWDTVRNARATRAARAVIDAAIDAARNARDTGVTQAHYDAMTGPWRKAVKPIHLNDQETQS